MVCVPDSKTSLSYFINQKADDAEMVFWQKWIEPNDVVWDVGANIGHYSLFLASCVGKEGGILAVEPGEKTFALLCLSIETAGISNVKTVQKCISDKEGFVKFAGEDGETDLKQHVVEDGGRLVKSTTLDKLLSRNEFDHPSFIKIDIEGSEPAGLKGASQLLTSTVTRPAFMVEIYPRGLRRLNQIPDDVLEFFPSEEWFVLFVNFSFPNNTPDIPINQVLRFSDLKIKEWPITSNLLCLPLVGYYRQRTFKILKDLGFVK